MVTNYHPTTTQGNTFTIPASLFQPQLFMPPLIPATATDTNTTNNSNNNINNNNNCNNNNNINIANNTAHVTTTTAASTSQQQQQQQQEKQQQQQKGQLVHGSSQQNTTLPLNLFCQSSHPPTFSFVTTGTSPTPTPTPTPTTTTITTAVKNNEIASTFCKNTIPLISTENNNNVCCHHKNTNANNNSHHTKDIEMHGNNTANQQPITLISFENIKENNNDNNNSVQKTATINNSVCHIHRIPTISSVHYKTTPNSFVVFKYVHVS